MKRYVYMWQNMSRRVFDFFREVRDIKTLPVPTVNGQTIKVEVGSPETYIKFTGEIGYDFNLEVTPVNCKLGDKLYMIVDGNSGSTITSTGALNFNNCGPESPPSQYNLSVDIAIIPFVYDGTTFYGLDYC